MHTVLSQAFLSADSADRPEVDREARVMRGVAVITRGEALGHRLWIDETMLHQVIAAGNANAAKGIPMRWSHPSLCNDGMGKQVGRAFGFRYDPKTQSVRADVRFYQKTTGQRAELIETIFDLAQEDPEVLGLSIDFYRDLKAEEDFMAAHSDPDGGGFTSPDPDNVENFPHCRLAKLSYIDFVNEPAANPSGLFSAPVAMSVVEPTVWELFDAFRSGTIDPMLAERFKATFGISFDVALSLFRSYMDARGLVIVPRNEAVATTTTANTETVAEATSDTSLEAQEEREMLRAISYESAHPNGTPKAPEDEPWDGPGEVAKADVFDLKIMCAWVEDGKEDLKTAYKFPHHKAEGRHPVVWRAVANAAARLPQANIPDKDRPGVERHLSRHYREFGKEPPFSRDGVDWEGYYQELASYSTPLSDDELIAILKRYGLELEAQVLAGVSVEQEKETHSEEVKVQEAQQSDQISIEVLSLILDDSIKKFRSMIGK